MPFRRSSRLSERAAAIAILACLAACGDPSGSTGGADGTVEFDAALKDRISISGVSSGAYLAIQAHVAYAEKIGSVAAIAAGPYHCAEGSVQTALARCMTGEGLDVEPLIANTRDFSSAGTIAPLDDLAGSRVWIYHSPADSVVSPTAGTALFEFYTAFVDASAVVFVDEIESAHGWVTVDAGVACNELGGDFVNACDYDAAGAILAHAYGELDPRVGAVAANLVVLDVGDYFDSDSNVSDSAYAYVPDACQSRSVRRSTRSGQTRRRRWRATAPTDRQA